MYEENNLGRFKAEFYFESTTSAGQKKPDTSGPCMKDGRAALQREQRTAEYVYVVLNVLSLIRYVYCRFNS